MSAVNLDSVNAGLHGALGRVGKALDEALDLRHGHLLGRRVALIPGDGARRPQVVWPAAEVLGGDVAGTGVPQAERAGFPAGMGELDADLLALRVHEINNALQGRDLAVLPQARVLGRDAAIGGYGGGLDDGEGDTAEGEGANVDEVPICEVAVIGRVHAHGADGETVLEGQVAELEGGEERGQLGVCLERSAGRGGLRRGVVGDARCAGAGGELLASNRHVGQCRDVWIVCRYVC